MAIEVSPITVKGALTPTGGFLYAYTHTLTPYWGCSYGRSCFYCYVGESSIQRFYADDRQWGDWVKPKINIAEVLEQELAGFTRKKKDLKIFFSGATEAFPPGLEPKYRLSGKCLEAFRRFPPTHLVIQTRSPFVERYFDIIAAIPTAVLSITIETDNDNIRRQFTPSCATVERRFAVARAAVAHGIFTQITASPALPHNPERFASLIANSCHRVIVDDFFNGDGAKGTRSRLRGVPETLAHGGYPQWFGPDTTCALVTALQQRMGNERVGYSREGFNQM